MTNWKKYRYLFLLICLVVVSGAFVWSAILASTTGMVSTAITSDNRHTLTQASDTNRGSIGAAINADGSRIVFASDSDFLSQGIPDGQNEIWLYDSEATALQRITTTSANGRSSFQPGISGDGTKIVFRSDSDFLNQGISDNQYEIWLYDTAALTYTRVTTTTDAARSNARPHISSDGKWIVFESDADLLGQGIPDNQTEVWLYNVATAALSRLTTASAADRFSGLPRINADGSKVVFVSDSDFLSQGIPFDQPEIWLLNINTMALMRITTASDAGRWSLAPDIDDNGTHVVFQSDSDFSGQGIISGQTEIWRYDVNTTQLTCITMASAALIPVADSTAPRISGNGRYIVFESINDFSGQDRMGTIEIWLYDAATNSTQRVTTEPNGITDFSQTSYAPDINTTGSAIAFHSNVDFIDGTTQNVSNEVWLYQSPTPTPELLMNHMTGAPNSYFSVTGQNFPTNSTAEITVNGRSLDTTSVDSNGRFLFILTTASADEGVYHVTASVNPSATIQFVLDAAEPVRPQEDTGDTFDVPAGIAFTEFVYLPVIIR